MLTWLENKGNAQTQVRSGSGVVTGVSGVNPTTAPDGSVTYERYRASILVDPPTEKPGAMRYNVIPTIDADQPALLEAAINACKDKQHVEWVVEWSRLPHIPDDIPLGALNFARDMVAHLRGLSPNTIDVSLNAG